MKGEPKKKGAGRNPDLRVSKIICVWSSSGSRKEIQTLASVLRTKIGGETDEW